MVEASLPAGFIAFLTIIGVTAGVLGLSVGLPWFLSTRKWGSLTKPRTPLENPVPLRLYVFEGKHALQLCVLADMAKEPSSSYEGNYRLWEYVARYVPGSGTYLVKGTARGGWAVSLKTSPTAVVVVNDTTVSLKSVQDMHTLLDQAGTELIHINDDTPRIFDTPEQPTHTPSPVLA
jgi:hypothetical protein